MTPCGATRHDYIGYYRHACRCPEGREAYRLYRKRLRQGRGPIRLVPALGTTRRLQALMAIGYAGTDLAPAIGWDKTLSGLLARKSVRPETAARVRRVYAELHMTPGPSRWARTHAAKQGWLPPLAWDDIDDPETESSSTPARSKVLSKDTDFTDVDTVAVERVLGGERLPLNPAEQAEVVRQLLERGQGVGRIGQVLHVNGKTARRLLDRVSGACA